MELCFRLIPLLHLARIFTAPEELSRFTQRVLQVILLRPRRKAPRLASEEPLRDLFSLTPVLCVQQAPTGRQVPARPAMQEDTLATTLRSRPYMTSWQTARLAPRALTALQVQAFALHALPASIAPLRQLGLAQIALLEPTFLTRESLLRLTMQHPTA